MNITLDSMKDMIFLLIHLLSTIAKRLQPGGGKTVVVKNPLCWRATRQRKRKKCKNVLAG
jgi:hypothetical protein